MIRGPIHTTRQPVENKLWTAFGPSLDLVESNRGRGHSHTCVQVAWCVGDGVGGPERVRTVDLFHAMEARSQLRHRPIRAYFDHTTAKPPRELTRHFIRCLQ